MIGLKANGVLSKTMTALSEEPRGFILGPIYLKCKNNDLPVRLKMKYPLCADNLKLRTAGSLEEPVGGLALDKLDLL